MAVAAMVPAEAAKAAIEQEDYRLAMNRMEAYNRIVRSAVDERFPNWGNETAP
jgi:hypothetical protein